MKVVYTGQHDEVYVAPQDSEGFNAKRGEEVDVPKAVGDSLLEQDTWSRPGGDPQPQISKKAQALANELDVDLDSVKGSGKNGNITVADVKAAAEAADGEPKEAETAPADETTEEEE